MKYTCPNILLLLVLSTFLQSCGKDNNDNTETSNFTETDRFQIVEEEQKEEEENTIQLQDPFEIEFALEDISDTTHCLSISIIPHEGYFFWAPGMNNMHTGRVSLTFDANPRIEKVGNLEEYHSLKGDHVMNSFYHNINDTITFKQEFILRSESQIEVLGLFHFVLTPRHSSHDVPFKITNKYGKLEVWRAYDVEES